MTDRHKVIVTNRQDNKILLEYITDSVDDAELVVDQFRTVKKSTGIQISVALYYSDGFVAFHK